MLPIFTENAAIVLISTKEEMEQDREIFLFPYEIRLRSLPLECRGMRYGWIRVRS